MLRDLVTILYAMALALGIGSFSAERVTDEFDGFGALTLGQWTAYPDAGTENADPYARARAARTGQLTLGTAEGLRFVAQTDNDGAPIVGQCDYAIEGRVPSSRLWTLRIVDSEGMALDTPAPFAARTHSRAVLRAADRSFTIAVSKAASAGNWMYLDHDGPVQFVLTLYDTTVAGAAALTETGMPAVRRVGCAR